MVGAGVILAATRHGLGKEVAEAGAAVSFVGSFTASVTGARLNRFRNRIIPETIEAGEVIDPVLDKTDGLELFGEIIGDLLRAWATSNKRQRELQSAERKSSRLVLYHGSKE